MFPNSILRYKLPNGEDVHRDWLVWSESNQALSCFPCRLFTPSSNTNHSLLGSSTGYSKDNKWKKLYDRIPEHLESTSHKRMFCSLEEFPKGYWMQRHNFSAIKQKYISRTKLKYGRHCSIEFTSCFVPW